MLTTLKTNCARQFVRAHCAISRIRNGKAPLRVEFFTLVLNGMPFVAHHIETFQKLRIPWRWHIIEGLAELKRDTAWSVHSGGRISEKFHRNGLSIDGTTEYIDDLRKQFPDRIVIHRKANGDFWDGKVEMCNAPIKYIKQPCLLWQLDVDEFWTATQINTMARLFKTQSTRTAAWFFCRFFVGRKLMLTTRNCYANNPATEWLRVWNYLPGMIWQAHEPPTLILKTPFGDCDIGRANPFLHEETEADNLVFDHYAYVLSEQLKFKEEYYGYKDALARWQRLQTHDQFPVRLKEFFQWVDGKTWVDRGDAPLLDLIIIGKNEVLFDSRSTETTK